MDKYSVHSDMRGDVAVVTASGRFDSETAPSLDAELSKIAAEKNKIVLDLKGVNYLSSSGLRAIVKALQAVQKSGGGVRLACASEPVETILRTVGMMEMLKMYPSINDAVASF
ncbi:MAG: STAS domain-containing protein [Chloroflexi bacterium]|nr:STAS domain-containing protein [Chloroflexota bacterium]